MIAVLMGVTGTGKSTVAEELVRRTGWRFAEGDAYHSAANVAKMHSGVALTDADRQPWLESLHAVLSAWQQEGASGVMTCSALKQSYRETLRGSLGPGELRFVLLEVSKQVLAERLAHRVGHFMNAALLDSQLSTLERPADAIAVDATRSPAEVAISILRALQAN